MKILQYLCLVHLFIWLLHLALDLHWSWRLPGVRDDDRDTGRGGWHWSEDCRGSVNIFIFASGEAVRESWSMPDHWCLHTLQPTVLLLHSDWLRLGGHWQLLIFKLWKLGLDWSIFKPLCFWRFSANLLDSWWNIQFFRIVPFALQYTYKIFRSWMSSR